MDMEVDTEVLNAVRNALWDYQRALGETALTLTRGVTHAGERLAGDQYNLCVGETTKSRKMIQAWIVNLSSLRVQLKLLEDAAQEYLKCKYGG